MFFSSKISAQEKSLHLSTAESIVQIESITDFTIGLNGVEENALTLQYPKSFQLEEEKFKQENSDKVQNIEVDSRQHQLSFMLKNKNTTEIVFSGEFLEQGEQKLTVYAGVEKEQLLISVQGATAESTSDQVKSSNVLKTTSTEEMTTRSLSDNTLEAVQPRADILPSFDWNLLNTDGTDLSTYEQVSVNTPVKLTGSAFDQQQRDYYMFFGHVGKMNTYKYDTGFNTQGNMYAPLGEKSMLPLLSPMMIGVKKQVAAETSTGLFGYDYSYTDSNVGGSGANFDIGEIDSQTGTISKAGITDPVNLSVSKTWIISQYVKENEILSYGFVAKQVIGNKKETFYQPVRVHGYVVSKGTGRIRYDISFYNEDQEEKEYALTYGAHMDVGGAHTNSRLFSYGESGLYFDEPTKTPVDKLPARIYFYMNNGYGNQVGPADYKSGNLYETTTSSGKQALYKIGYWSDIKIQRWLNPMNGYTTPYEPWDPFQPMGYEFPLKHPVFALRWNKINVKPNDVGTGSLDLSIEEPAPILPVAEKNYTNESSTNNVNRVGDTLSFSLTAMNRGDIDIWEQVNLTDTLPKELELDTSSLILVDENGIESQLDPAIYDEKMHKFTAGAYNISPKKQIEIKYKAKIISGIDQTIINKFTATNQKAETAEAEVQIPVSERLDFKLKEEVFHEDGTVAEKANQGETLLYRTTIFNPNSLGKLNYRSLQGYIPLDTNLENVKEGTLKDQSGNIIGIVVYSAASNSVIYSGNYLEETDILPINQDIYVEYKATVKQDTPDGSLIKAQANFWADFKNDTALDQDDKPTSNEVQTEIVTKRGDLLFVSAPTVLDFGENLKISAKNKSYPIASKDDALVVEDYRGTGEHWSMTATLLKELSSTSGHQLTNSLHYKNQNQDYIFTLGNAIPVIEKETTDEQGVDISADWASTNNGPFLDVKAGQPRAEKYSGSIKWTLQDVPANDQE
ncbi:hypothetical protein ATZ33_16090 [Enterococcus silesiacus]|uniref:WxL domain-containing protein n=1 Tax=Enterococcus silesiacus TaxID=332949 RepID=A0A0S3KEY1_9ENTE|nr:WxL domain-containing protein [Enterococcus silesiacus]ALS02840.1 hypothetical protein ATZ33_16090 [Enterococcus silesiacus]OJG85815.1 hypothetical protein RV15_GL002494 [Enterococcus silesiacus]